MAEQDLRTIGVIRAPHGLQGTVRLDPLSDFPERFLHLNECFLRRSDRTLEKAVILRVKLATRQVLITFESVCTRNDAESLRGCELCIPESETWPLPKDSYYTTDILGFRVISDSGEFIGELTDVIQGSQDILQIDGPNGELLVPFVDEWVGDVDMTAKTIVIRSWQRLVNPESSD